MKIDTLLKDVKSVGITGHVRPDGDCVGSTLGLYNYITNVYPDLEVDIYLEDFSESFNFLNNSDKIDHSYEKEKEYDIFFALDSGDLARIGNATKYFETAKKTICIDHHISNQGYADENNIVADASSASELVYLCLDEDKITKDVAEALYMGMVHDTGVFQYSSTSAQTMRIAGKLMEMGIDFSKIVDETFYQKTFAQNQILGRALQDSYTLLDGKAIASVVTKEIMKSYSVGPKDLDGIVNQLRVTKGVECAIFIYEMGTQDYKVSLRSNGKVDVNSIAANFGGGGHIKAAGCTVQGDVHEMIEKIAAKVNEQLS